MRISSRLASVVAASTMLVAAANAAPAGAVGTGDPAIVSPTADALVPAGDTGPVRVDFSDAPVGDYTVRVQCTGTSGYDDVHSAHYAGTGDDAQQFTLAPLPASSTCSTTVDATPADPADPHRAEAGFRVDAPPVRLTRVTPSPGLFYPRVRDGYRDESLTGFTLTRRANVRVGVRNPGGGVTRSVRMGWLGAGRHTFQWGGRNNAGQLAKVGTFTVIIRATDSSGHEAMASRKVTVASRLVTAHGSRTLPGNVGARSTSGACYATKLDGVMTLDCWGGHYARATYRFRVPRSASHTHWRVVGGTTDSDICCQGRITRTGHRATTTRYAVRVQVTGWRTYDIRRVHATWRYQKRI